MKVVTIENPRIYLMPRYFPELESDLISVLINEETKESVTTEPLIWTIENQLIKTIVFDPQDLISLVNYEFTILDGSNVVYKGKLMLVDDFTDIQNFNPQTQENKRWEE